MLASAGWLGTARASLVINLNFSDFSTDAPADGSPVLGGATLAQAQSVIQAAASVWETVFAASRSSNGWSTNIGGTLTQNIDVGWDALGGPMNPVLATGGTNWAVVMGQPDHPENGRWGSGTLTFDNDGTSNFFVDNTPTEHSEWGQFSERDMNFNGVDMNVDRNYFDASPGQARSNSDMLTVAIHEIGHALGFLGSDYPPFSDSDIGSDKDVDISSGPFSGAELSFEGGHTDIEIPTPGGAFMYDHNNMGPSIITGTRKLLTEVDIAIVAEYLEFDMATVNFNPQMAAVPEPRAWAFMSLATFVGFGLFYVSKARANERTSDGES